MKCEKFRCVFEIDGQREEDDGECIGEMCENFGECIGCQEQDKDECDGIR